MPGRVTRSQTKKEKSETVEASKSEKKNQTKSKTNRKRSISTQQQKKVDQGRSPKKSRKNPKLQYIFRGIIVHCLNLNQDGFHFLSDALIGVNWEGEIEFLETQPQDDAKLSELKSLFQFEDDDIVHLGNKFLVPGFVDTHTHAPQYSFSGTGTDLPLLEWLNTYTFPMESKFSNPSFATDVFTKAVQRSLFNGTTTACYFSTIHLEASMLLADIILKLGQRGFVGKVCMDQNSPSYYLEKSEDSLKETEDFIKYILEKKSDLITPVITPRFVPTCSLNLMEGLGKLAVQYDIPIQSHISENKDEVSWVKSLHPNINSYTEVYDHCGLLNKKTIMAHGIYLSEKELMLFKKREAAISHCPVSNCTLQSGILDLKRVMKYEVKVGLGTDVSGGYSPSILDSIRQCITASNTLHIYQKDYETMTWKEAFALATLGGTQVLGLDDKIGNFEPGKRFDALIIDPLTKDSPFDTFKTDTNVDIFQKWLFLGDNRNIDSIFVDGKKLKQEHK